MKTLGTAVALLAATTVARADWQNLDGQPAPNFAVEQWFNPTDGSTVEDLRGKAILVEFWATW